MRPGRSSSDAILEVEARHHRLAEEEDTVLGQAEEARTLEAGARCGVGRLARHHVPGHRPPVAASQAAQLLGLELEERTLRHRTQREEPLGPVVAEPGRLSAGHHHGRDAARAQRRLAALASLAPARGVAAVLGQQLDPGRLELAGVLGHRLAGLGESSQQGGQVDASRLLEQLAALRLAQAIPEAEHMALPVTFVAVPQHLDRSGIGGSLAGHRSSPRAEWSRRIAQPAASASGGSRGALIRTLLRGRRPETPHRCAQGRRAGRRPGSRPGRTDGAARRTRA